MRFLLLPLKLQHASATEGAGETIQRLIRQRLVALPANVFECFPIYEQSGQHVFLVVPAE